MGQRQSVEVHGTVAPGYESVREMFEENFRAGREENAQLCVYVGEQRVVDLWASLSNNPAFTGDSLTTVFSSTKSLTAICLARLVDRGLLDYRQRIAHYWPEFGQRGKEELTVADLMRHEAGLASFDQALPRAALTREAIKQNKVGAVIEQQEPHWENPSKRRAYHAVTRGWIANELFRRVEPSGATVGEELERLAPIIGPGIVLGVRDQSQLTAYHPVTHMTGRFVLGQSLVPQFLGRAIEPNFVQLCQLMMVFRQFVKDAAKKAPAFEGLGGNNEQWNDEDVRRGEIPSANGNCSARGLARMAAAMANGGKVGDCEVLGPAGWQALHAEPTDGFLYMRNSRFTQGGVAQMEEEDTSQTPGRDGYYGWMGYGGSVFQWHPELKIGFGYAPTLLCWIDLVNNKARLLQGEVARCARKIQEKK